MTAARLELSGLKRFYKNGDETIAALAGVDLVIEPGELIAIVGSSGSGKSTLMNILGCLDRASQGTYRVGGVDVATLDSDALATLRRDTFGFIFQRYHLISTLTTLGNIELPSIYADMSTEERSVRARGYAERLGLAGRLDHRPSQLSGGQQQRVAIARALMNGAGIILADEPTGALDSQSGASVLTLLKELHAEGRTVIMVTHDHGVAAHANRVIEIADGRIVADTRVDQEQTRLDSRRPAKAPHSAPRKERSSKWSTMANAVSMSFRSMNAHRMRSLLTMLGIVIGVVSVVAVMGFGEGARRSVMGELDQLGSSSISIFPGTGFDDPNALKVTTLTEDDAKALAGQPYVDSVTPEMNTNLTGRYGSRSVQLQVSGVGPGFLRAGGHNLLRGRSLTVAEMEQGVPNVILPQHSVTALFGSEDPIGRKVVIGTAPFTVIGVIAARQNDRRLLQAYIGSNALKTRLVGNVPLGSIAVRVKGDADTTAAEQAITSLLISRHGARDFFTYNSDQIRQSTERTIGIMTLLISTVAGVALLVGGIGVMNIMLISVTERTREIGLRLAIGARQTDIMTQFVIEAVSVCLVGGAIGIFLAACIAFLANILNSPIQIVLTPQAILLGSVTTTMIGLIFGYAPARNAARLDPVVALTSE